jgi:hypothetical protein
MKKIVSLLRSIPQIVSVWWWQLKPYQKVLAMIVSFVMVLVLLQLFLGTTPPQTNPSSSPQAPEPTLALPPARVLRQLPHEGDGYVVAYNEPTQEYLITVTAPPYETNVAKAYEWLASQQITAKTHSIRETWSRFKDYR